jgi:hypothetical protein
VRVPTPAMFTGKRGSFQFFASKVESYADISNVARDKWVAVALQCMCSIIRVLGIALFVVPGYPRDP